MLLNIFIQNFRSFRDPVALSLVAEASKSKEQNYFVQKINKGSQEDEERLLRSAVIFGANASGKSNLIRAVAEILEFVCHFQDAGGDFIEVYMPFLFDTTTNDAPVIFGIEFIAKDQVRYKYDISFDITSVISETLTYWPQGRPTMLLQRVKSGVESDIAHKIKFKSAQKKREEEEVVFRNQSGLSKFGNQLVDEVISNVFMYLNKINTVSPLSSNSSLITHRQISERLLTDVDLMGKMNELLRFADTGLKEITISKEERSRLSLNTDAQYRPAPRVHYNINVSHPMFSDKSPLSQDQMLPFSQESNGVKMLYTLGGKILNTIEEGGVIFVDELETSLHPYLSRLLVMLFHNDRINKRNAQLIFTSHDTNLLDRTFFRRDQVWFAQKDEFGITDLYSLQEFPDVREDTPFDKWYLAGKFGAVPDLKSLESLFPDM